MPNGHPTRQAPGWRPEEEHLEQGGREQPARGGGFLPHTGKNPPPERRRASPRPPGRCRSRRSTFQTSNVSATSTWRSRRGPVPTSRTSAGAPRARHKKPSDGARRTRQGAGAGARQPGACPTCRGDRPGDQYSLGRRGRSAQRRGLRSRGAGPRGGARVRRAARALARAGVETYDPTGQKFDPATCEALSVQAGGDGVDPGVVIETIEKGYRLDGQVLRAARVVVNE